MKALGRQLLVELHNCHPETLKRVNAVREILTSAAKAAKATIVDVAFHEFSPHGVSGVVVISESYISIHTWPEHRYAAVDIFTCGDTIVPEEVAHYVATRFRCKTASSVEVKRGIIESFGQVSARHSAEKVTAALAPSPI